MGAIPDSMVYVKETEQDTPWHGVGTPVMGLMTAQECLEKSGLNWGVKKVPMLYNDKPVLNHYLTVREDTDTVLGVVGGTYEVLTNPNAFSFFDGVVGVKGAYYETAGSLFGGRTVWLTARMGGDIRLKKGGKEDVIRKYLTLAHAHDGTMKVVMVATPIRTVCENTLTAAMESAETKFGIRHTRNLGAKLVEARDVLGLANTMYEDLAKAFARLTEVKVDSTKVEAYFQACGFNPDAEKGKAKSAFDYVVASFEGGKGAELPTAKGTLFGAYNAVTNYLTHERGTRQTEGYGSAEEAKLDSTMFGSGARMNEKALSVALAMAK